MMYKIGDIAKVMGVTTEAIRHYERMGLIRPEKDPQTKYRYFTEEQLSQLLYIQRLSQMGISLQLIREQFLNGSLHSYEQVIAETLQATQERLRILQMKTCNLMNCLDILQTAEQSRGKCMYGMRPDMYFISTKHCIQSSFAQEQPKGFAISPIMRISFSKARITMRKTVFGETRRASAFIRIVQNMHNIAKIRIFICGGQRMLFYAHSTIYRQMQEYRIRFALFLRSIS